MTLLVKVCSTFTIVKSPGLNTLFECQRKLSRKQDFLSKLLERSQEEIWHNEDHDKDQIHVTRWHLAKSILIRRIITELASGMGERLGFQFCQLLVLG